MSFNTLKCASFLKSVFLGWAPQNQSLGWETVCTWFIKEGLQEKSVKEWVKGEKEETDEAAIRPGNAGDSGMQVTPVSLPTEGKALALRTCGHQLRTTPGGWKLLGTSKTLPKRLADCSPRCCKRVGHNLATKSPQQMVWVGCTREESFFDSLEDIMER